MKSLTRFSCGLLCFAAAFSFSSARAQATFPNNSLVTVTDSAGATLLAPYFEVDLNNSTGMNTVISVANTSATSIYSGSQSYNDGATAVLAHVTIWSDLAVPVFNFNIYLTGYDVQKIDMRRVLNGVLPVTASAGQDPTDTKSPKGPYSQDINFASCNGGPAPSGLVYTYSALPQPPVIGADQIANMQSSLTGQPSAQQSGQCAGRNLGDNFARGYVTIDTVNNCTTRFPGDAGYFGAGGSGDATIQTQLSGEIYYVDMLHSVAYGGNLVHIHASSTDPLTSTAGNYTFYGRYNAWTATDNRQPLPTNFAARFLSALYIVPGSASGAAIRGGSESTELEWGESALKPSASNSGGTSKLIVWRDPKVAQNYFTCSSLPSWYPLGQENVWAFDEQEHPERTILSTPPGYAKPDYSLAFAAATQSVLVGGSVLPSSYTKGWFYLNLNSTVVAAGSNPPIDPAAAQAWVQVVEQSGDKKLNMMHNATAIDSGTDPNHSGIDF